MSKAQRLAELENQKSDLEVLVREASEDGDVVAKLNFKTRLDVLNQEIAALISKDAKIGEVAILFDGVPVNGSKAIDASFAALSLAFFQGLITRLYSSSLEGQLSLRGKIKGANLASLNVTAVATGSFGFVLEEKGADQSSAIKTPVREALEQAAALISEFTQEDEDNFLVEVDDINPRVFIALAKFFRHLEINSASMKAILPHRQYSFDRRGIERAFARISNTHVKIEPVIWQGRLVGLSPVKRSFEFKRDGSDQIVTGKFSHRVSQDYLERIENATGITLGNRFEASIEIGTIRKPDGSFSVTYTVNDLVDVGK